MQLIAENEARILAAQNLTSERSTNSSSSGSLGVSFGTDGLLFNASASKGKGQANGDDTSYTNTQIKAGEQVSLTTGGDATLQGAVIRAEQVKANIGGNLTIQSLQDTSTYTSKQESMGGSISVGYGKMSGSISASKSNIDSNFQSVAEQSGIKAGSGGFQVSVAGNTALLGSVIASDNQAVNAQKNSFKTGGTLSISDIQNTASYKGESIGISFGGGATAKTAGINGLGIGIGSDKADASSTSSAGISGIAGNTAVRSTDAETGLKPIFDAAKVQAEINAQVQITQAFTREAPKAAASFADSQAKALRLQGNEVEAKKWDENGAYRIALHTVIGALGGGLDGALGAATSASSANLMNALQDNLQLSLQAAGLGDGVAKSIAQVVAGLTAAGIGAAVGGTQGAATAWTVDANNRQLHPKEVLFLADKERIKRYAEYMRSQGVLLTEEQAGQALDRYGAAMADQNWSNLNGRDSTTERFILNEASKSNLFYVDSQGNSRQIFSVTAAEYKDELINLKPLFSAYESNPAVQKYLNDNFDKTRLTNWVADYKTGQQLGYQAAGNNASLLGDIQTILASLASAPKYIKDALISDEIGPFDNQQMKSYYQTLLKLQGRGLEAGYVSELDWATTQRLTLVGIPLAEFGGAAFGALVKLPGKLITRETVQVNQTIRIAETDVQIVTKEGQVLGYNPQTGVFEPAAPVPASANMNGPSSAVGPASPGYVITPTRDSSGQSIPVILATSSYSWGPTDPKNLIGSQGADHERAAIQYIQATENPIAIIDARSANGNGFDPSYIKKNLDGSYQLVIVEAKSGSGKITAFGEGARGEAQFDRNLSSLRGKIEGDASIPDQAKNAALLQIDKQTFQTQLFVGPGSNPSRAQLDLLRDATLGKNPVNNIVVLPKKSN